jgi:hypothetical protein
MNPLQKVFVAAHTFAKNTKGREIPVLVLKEAAS